MLVIRFLVSFACLKCIWHENFFPGFWQFNMYDKLWDSYKMIIFFSLTAFFHAKLARFLNFLITCPCIETWYGLSPQNELESEHPVKKYKIIQYFLDWQLLLYNLVHLHYIFIWSPVRVLSSSLGDLSVPWQLDNKMPFITVRSSYEIIQTIQFDDAHYVSPTHSTWWHNW